MVHGPSKIVTDNAFFWKAKHLCPASEGVGGNVLAAGDRGLLLSPYQSFRAASVGDDTENLVPEHEWEGFRWVVITKQVYSIST